MEDFAQYLTANLAVGIGIAADAMIATLARFRRFGSWGGTLRWAGAIGLTHWLFPMVGFIGGWYLAVGAHGAILVYGAGALVMGWFVLHVAREASTPGPATNIGPHHRPERFWLSVWVVSIDALITGPGKAAVTKGWSAHQIWLSFPLVGGVVFTLVLAAAMSARLLHRRLLEHDAPDPRTLARSLVLGVAVEVAVFSWFGCLAVVETLRARGAEVSSAVTWASWGVALVLLAIRFGSGVCRQQFREANALLQGG